MTLGEFRKMTDYLDDSSTLHHCNYKTDVIYPNEAECLYIYFEQATEEEPAPAAKIILV